MRHLVLVGGGHSHLSVLRAFAMRGEVDLRLTLVTPSSYSLYSGMIPGILSGQYQPAEARIDVRALAARAGATFIPDTLRQIDAENQLLHLSQRPPIQYDLLSLDIGAAQRGLARIETGAPILLVKPIEQAMEKLENLLSQPRDDQRKIAIVGGGAAGIEIAFALAKRVRAMSAAVTVFDPAPGPVWGHRPSTRRLVQKNLARAGIRFHGGSEVMRAQSDGLVLSTGEHLPADLIVWATGPEGPELFRRSGLPVDAQGFLEVTGNLCCAQHPEIFGAGDCVSLPSAPNLPKAGVHAVRQGPLLARNLRLALQNRPLRFYKPQRNFLSLLNTGDGQALLSYGRLATRSRWAWLLKNRIDRGFVGQYARPEPAPQQETMASLTTCGGCAAKVEADVLRRVLARLPIRRDAGLRIGLTEADDAAVIDVPPGHCAVATIDVFPPFSGDLFLVGQVAANNAASDLYAMGAEGAAALAMVCLPRASPREQEQHLENFLSGAIRQLDLLGIPLAGGHSVAGDQFLLGFSMHGSVEPGRIFRKSGAQPGDSLVLTKPLGTGVILAAARSGAAAAEWVEAAIDSMLRTNGTAMRLLRAHGVRACTDVTGFGLIGHLEELAVASGVRFELEPGAIPALPGARELLEAGWRTSTSPAVARKSEPVDPLWADPQTSGGLLAAVPAEGLEGLRLAFAEAGESLFVIGRVTGHAVKNHPDARSRSTLP